VEPLMKLQSDDSLHGSTNALTYQVTILITGVKSFILWTFVGMCL
jgi:hypothetical protein